MLYKLGFNLKSYDNQKVIKYVNNNFSNKNFMKINFKKIYV